MSFTVKMGFSIDVVRTAGQIVRGELVPVIPKKSRQQVADLPVSDQITEMVKIKIRENFEGHHFFGDERSHRVRNSHTWVTALKGTGEHQTFSLAYVDHGNPVVGVVYLPFQNKLITAEQGHGAFMDKQMIRVSGIKGLGKSSIINLTSWSGAQISLDDMHELEGKLVQAGARVRRSRHITATCIQVASGEISAAINPAQRPSEIAALAIIVREAGGIATNYWGHDLLCDDIVFGCVMSSNMELHRRLIRLCRKD